MSKHKREFDQHLVDALKRISWPIIDKNGKKVFVRSNARNESGFEHIAGKCHLLKVRDIELIPSVLKNPQAIENDKRKGTIYYGKRKGVNKSPYLKIVAKKEKNGDLKIITVCTSKICP